MACRISKTKWESLKGFGIIEEDSRDPRWWVDAVNIHTPWDGYIDLRNTTPPPPSPPDSMSESMSESMQELPTCEPTKTKVCWYFVNSICSYGKNCMHSHILPPSRLQPVVEREICTHFQKGRCSFGDGCFKLHVPKTR